MTGIHIAESLRVFRTVVDRGSFAAAARELKLSSAWVAKTIGQLENHLGVSLFARSTRSLTLTDAGSICYQSADKVLAELAHLKDLMRDSSSDVSGSLRLSLPIVLAGEPMGALIAGFQERYPDVELNIEVSDRFVDVLHDGFDIVLRLAHKLNDSTIVVRKLRQIPKILCAAPVYIQDAPALNEIEDLQNHRCLVYSGLQEPDKWHFVKDGQITAVTPQSGMRVNNSHLIRSTLLAGRGIGLVPEIIVAADLGEGRLIRLSQLVEALPLSLFALRPPSRHIPLRTKLLWNHFVDHWGKDKR